MKYFLFLTIMMTVLSGCNSAPKGSGTKQFDVILSKQLDDAGVKVIDQSARESGTRSIRIFIVLNKEVDGIMISKAITNDNMELAGGVISEEPIVVGNGSGSEEFTLPPSKLTNRGYIYTQAIDPMDLNLIKAIKLEILHK